MRRSTETTLITPHSFVASWCVESQDTVTEGSGEGGCTEYLLYRSTLVELAARHGLAPIEMESLADARAQGNAAPLGASERLVAGLYFTFAFRKTGGAPSPARVGMPTG